jgi:glucan-binding YG repeat protein
MRKRFNLFRLILILGAFFFLMPFIPHAESQSVEQTSESSNQIENITDTEQQVLQDEEVSLEALNEELETKENDDLDNVSDDDRSSEVEPDELEEENHVDIEHTPVGKNSESQNKEVENDEIEKSLESEEDKEEEIEQENLPSKDVTNLEENSNKEHLNTLSEDDYFQILQGVLDLRLFPDASLNSQIQTKNQDYQLNLTYEASTTLGLGLLSRSYVVFYLPSSLINQITKEDLSMSYDVPSILGRDSDTFTKDQIKIEGNQIYVELNEFLRLSLFATYKFTLTIDLGELPESDNFLIPFFTEVLRGDLIDITLLGEDITRSNLLLPPLIKEPIYDSHTVIEGAGAPGSSIFLEINGERYTKIVDQDGNFSVDIPKQKSGTIITSWLIHQDADNPSIPVTVTVEEEPILAFDHAPDNITFDTTEISSGFQRIPIYSTDGVLSVIDTRGEGSTFQIQAQSKPLFNEKYNHTLSNVIKYRDERGVIHDLFEAKKIYSGTTGEETITEVRWDENQGPFIEVDPSNAYEGTYNSTITWTLVDGP